MSLEMHDYSWKLDRCDGTERSLDALTGEPFREGPCRRVRRWRAVRKKRIGGAK